MATPQTRPFPLKEPDARNLFFFHNSSELFVGRRDVGFDNEDEDGVPSNHGSTSSPYNYDQSVKRKGFDTPIDPITKKKRALFVWNNRVSSNF